MGNPTLSDIIKRSQTDVQAELDNFNPSLKNSFINSFVISNAGRFKELYGQIDLLALRLLLLTSENDFLDAWGSIWSVIRQEATQATGDVIATGTAGIVIPNGSVFISDESLKYTSNADATITATNRIANLNVASLIVTATLADHGLATGVSVLVTGASNSAINGNFDIVVIDADSFEFTLETTIPDGDYGDGNIIVNYATVNVTSDDYSSDTNLNDGTSISLETSITGVNDSVFVGFSGVSGGTDVETDAAYRSRVLFRTRNPVSFFSESYIKDVLFELSYITRVWVLKNNPGTNFVTIYFVKDNDTDIIPTTNDLDEAKAKIEIPVTVPESNVIFAAPTELATDFIFTSIDPSTDAMKESIKNNLKQFFTENGDIGAKLTTPNTIPANQYIKAILSAVDQETGEPLNDFVLASPTGNITVADNEVPTLGNVTF